jgi:C4-dicarboxylate-specific signal transduction histidine kinase
LDPAQLLLYTSGLILFWLMPLIAWLLLKGQRDSPARCWFAGTASYAIVGLLFVFQGPQPHWAALVGVSVFANLMVMLLIESMLLELQGGRTRWGRWVLSSLLIAAVIALTQVHIGLEEARSVQLVIISGLDLLLLVLLARVARAHRSRALLFVILMVVVVLVTNLLRVWAFVSLGESTSLAQFTTIAMVGFLANYLSVVFYSFGYWGFVIEKGRAALLRAIDEAGSARDGETSALHRERLTQELLRERDELISRLGAMQRIVHVGALSASIAHEINQPLASSRLSAEEALVRLRDGRPVEVIEPLIERIVGETDRAAGIVRTLRDLFRGRKTEVDHRSLDEIIQHIAHILEQRVRESDISVRLQLDCPAVLPAGAGELEHVVLNLITNAIEAVQSSPPGGRWIAVRTALNENGAVFEVSDSGPGVPLSKQSSLFNLAQSSKSDGLGLGLWLSRYIVERYGGIIEYLDGPRAGPAAPAPVSGARFVVRIPMTSGERSVTVGPQVT